MDAYMDIIKKAPLFRGVSEEEIGSMLRCLSATVKSFPKDAFLLRCGEPAPCVCLVLDGSVHLIREDYWGDCNLIAKFQPGELFAETYACVEGQPLEVSVVAVEKATVLFLDVQRVLTTCSSACVFHARVIRNLVSLLAQKNLLLSKKIAHLSQRTTRRKLLSYLSAEAEKHGSSFDIVFNRQQLADYLSVDRSAMSAELCKMRDDGLLRFDRNHFELL